jgi:hypothetical protein
VQGFIIVAVLLIARRGVLGTAKYYLQKLAERQAGSAVDTAVPAAVAPPPARLPEKEPAP